MFTIKRILIVFACALLCASPLAAQSRQQETRPAGAGSQSVTSNSELMKEIKSQRPQQ